MDAGVMHNDPNLQPIDEVDAAFTGRLSIWITECDIAVAAQP